MKKYLSLILVCVICFTTLSVGATAYEFQSGAVITINGENTELSSVIYNNTHYVPMKKVLEKLGAIVFYRSDDGCSLILAPNGDMMLHTTGENIIVVNGEERSFASSSFLENNETYIPVEMILTTFWPDGIFADNQQLIINKNAVENDYLKVIKDVLDVAWLDNFYPEKFQEYVAYHAKMPSYSMQDVILRVNIELDEPYYQNPTVIENPHELLVLVNKYNKLPSGFMQYNLVNMSGNYTARDGKQYLLEAGAYEHYMQMADAAKRDGISMHVVSAYRTEGYQANLYNNRLRISGRTYADNYSARAGHSEHQTGLAVDINSTYQVFEYSAAFKWLQKHAHEYGFILRYPRGKEWITGYSYEPWHYRYVGTDVAKIIYEKGITYEEYYADYVIGSEFK